MSDKPRACVFCGATPLSSEHIWSEWTYKILPKLPGGTHVRGVRQSANSTPKIKGLRSLKKYQGQDNTIRIRAVCGNRKNGTNSLGKASCNNGWMSRQEEAVKPSLTPLILGQPIVLGRDRQRVLASWVATKVMVAEHSEPEDIVSTKAERTYVMTHGEAPPHWRIWIARQTGKLWRTGYARHSATLGALDETDTPVTPDRTSAKNTQMVSIGMEFLLIHVFSTREPKAQINYPSRQVLFRIHPFDTGLVWPPTRVINGAQIDYLMRRFDNWLGGLTWRASP